MRAAELKKIVSLLKKGELIAYPTEGVFGLGCDPMNEKAIQNLLQLKKRSVKCGLIIIAADWGQLSSWLGNLPAERLRIIKEPSTEVITWVVPASKNVAEWIQGTHATIAVRVTQHPTAKAICAAFGAPIVSTSANITAHAPCVTYDATKKLFGESVKFIVNAPTGNLNKASKICDALSGKILRA